MRPLVARSDLVIHADPKRVVARLFVPGNEVITTKQSRAGTVTGRVLDLPEDTVESLVADVRARWSHRHRDLEGVLAGSFAQIAHRVPGAEELSGARRTLLGAYFTQEQSIEAAALFNPSLAPHPDQDGLAPGVLRFVMSLRAVGEGHVSCIEWRTGTVDATGAVQVDDPGPHAEIGVPTHTLLDRTRFAAGLLHAGADGEAAAFLTARLPEEFDHTELDRVLGQLESSTLDRPRDYATLDLARHLARRGYEVTFPPETTLAERVLRPHGPTETQGMEDARLVRFVDDDGTVTYKATYTAFDGRKVAPQLIESTDLRRFRVSVLTGPAAVDKGMALFPRPVGDAYLALTRSDRETTGVTSSPDGSWWGPPTPLRGPTTPWDLVQTGNCGSPIETDEGWLVLTHGVGPMREYVLGALLLDLDDPSRVVGELAEPLLRPAEDEREGYVPNVVYSCGALRHGDLLLLPYGCSDAAVRFAVVDLLQLLDLLTGR